MSIIANLNSMRTQIKEKRLMNEVYVLKEAWELWEIYSYEHIPTSFMIADGLTKVEGKLRDLLVRAMKGRIQLPREQDRGEKAIQYRVIKER